MTVEHCGEQMQQPSFLPLSTKRKESQIREETEDFLEARRVLLIIFAQ